MKTKSAVGTSLRLAKKTWADSLSREACSALADILEKYNLSVASGDVLYLNNHWYVTHSGSDRLGSSQSVRGHSRQPPPKLL